MSKNTNLVRPTIWDDFACIAGQCDFTCCQEWKIYVDDATYDKWKVTDVPEDALTSLANVPSVKKKFYHTAGRLKLSETTMNREGQRVICLREDHNCPYLNEQKLCHLVINEGDQILSETCQQFPREQNEFADRTEDYLLVSCPAVLDLLREKGFDLDYVKIDYPEEETGYPQNDVAEHTSDHEIVDNDQEFLHNMRTVFFDILKRKEIDSRTAMLAIGYLLTQQHLPTQDELGQLLDAVDQLPKDEEHLQEGLVECNELFLDLIQEYRKQKMYVNLLEPAAQAAEKLEADYQDKEGQILLEKIDLDSLYKFEKAWDEYDGLIKPTMAAVLYGSVLQDGFTNVDFQLMTEWAMMEYATIRHMAYLCWIEKGELTYKDLRDRIIVVHRMMGYEPEDIEEYLAASFEDVIWPWEYIYLIMQ